MPTASLAARCRVVDAALGPLGVAEVERGKIALQVLLRDAVLRTGHAAFAGRARSATGAMYLSPLLS